ncbi:OB-fold nucleic acid binding domain-containing protein [Propionicimonas sp.]|uniref:OB-fold nucleic acid binding domain-containing protein n=1 Tax=Propionicimonas sp. TaxID=1955623 RepID=UPI0039E618DB
MASANPFLRALRRLGASNAELESEARQRIVQSVGATRVSELQDRQWARLRGTISVLTMKPRSGTPWLEAEFNDGSGTVTLIWMGRRAIPGIVAGRELTVSGRVSYVDGQRRLYNPYYELIAG